MRRITVVLVLAFAMCGVGGAGAERTMTADSLAAQARYVAMHGGITGSCYGCATRRMRDLTARLIVQRFGRAASRALCFARRESGLNPGAISSSDDHGAFQIHRAGYHPFDFWRIDHDPAYSVQVGWIVSDHGTNWGPWSGGRYAC